MVRAARADRNSHCPRATNRGRRASAGNAGLWTPARRHRRAFSENTACGPPGPRRPCDHAHYKQPSAFGPACCLQVTPDGHLPASASVRLCQSGSLSWVTVGWRGWHLPLMTSCRLTWLLGRLCRVSGGMSSRQPGGSSGSSSTPDRTGSPSSPGSGLRDKGLVKALA